jgi:uncharacterized spore protein YtfJ
MALQGSLSELSLPDVIQLVSVSGKTGAFHITRDGEEGRIYLKDGQIVDAFVGRLRGESAVYELAIWSSGEFAFHPGEVAEQVTVKRSNANLMMEAARRLDEWRVLSRKIPSLDMIPYFPSREGGQDQVTLSPQEWVLVTKVDGARSIEEIAELLGWAAFDVSKLLFGMVTSGLVALKKPGEAGAEGGGLSGRNLSPVTLLGLAEKIRSMALAVIGESGQRTIEKQYLAARTAIETGQGLEALKALVDQNTKAISLLRGADVAAMFEEQVRPLLGEFEST